jgi:hypothetical protein
VRVTGVICRQCAAFVYTRAPLDARHCPGRHIVVGYQKPPRESAGTSLTGGVPSTFAPPNAPVNMTGATPGEGFLRMPGCTLPMHAFVPASAEVRTTTEALFYDWNNRADKFGIIPAPAYGDFDVLPRYPRTP